MYELKPSRISRMIESLRAEAEFQAERLGRQVLADELTEAAEMLEALNRRAASGNKPLTLKQVKQLKPGTPVSIVCDDKIEEFKEYGFDLENDYWGYGDVADGTIKVYARKPEGSEKNG